MFFFHQYVDRHIFGMYSCVALFYCARPQDKYRTKTPVVPVGNNFISEKKTRAKYVVVPVCEKVARAKYVVVCPLPYNSFSADYNSILAYQLRKNKFFASFYIYL